jgi:hypothetical protein
MLLAFQSGFCWIFAPWRELMEDVSASVPSVSALTADLNVKGASVLVEIKQDVLTVDESKRGAKAGWLAQ